jgi:molybdopterin molybdotransferase
MRELIGIEEARAIVLDAAEPMASESVDLAAAFERVLARGVVSPGPVPPFTGSAMDGYALRAEDLLDAGRHAPVALRLIGESRAGHPSSAVVSDGEAIAISTGAVMPAGADTVVPVEATRALDGTVEVHEELAIGTFVRPAGGDVGAGEVVLAPGTRLGAAELGMLAAVGCGRPVCVRRPRLRLLTTGDELLAADERMRPGGVRDSNRHTLPHLARAAGAEIDELSSVCDEPAELTAAVAEALQADVTVICGGVSIGVHDHVKEALRANGVRERFSGIALKPGKPTWFGTRERRLVFGLPGNPVSAMVTFILLVAPALRAMAGAGGADDSLSAILAEDYEKSPGRAHAVRCRLQMRSSEWWAMPTGAQDSHLLSSMLGADGLAMIPRSSAVVRAGEHVEVLPLGRLTGACA